MKTFNDYKEKLMENPEFVKEYETIQSELKEVKDKIDSKKSIQTHKDNN